MQLEHIDLVFLLKIHNFGCLTIICSTRINLKITNVCIYMHLCSLRTLSIVPGHNCPLNRWSVIFWKTEGKAMGISSILNGPQIVQSVYMVIIVINDNLIVFTTQNPLHLTYTLWFLSIKSKKVTEENISAQVKVTYILSC